MALAGDWLYLVEGQCNSLNGCMSGSLQPVTVILSALVALAFSVWLWLAVP